MDAYLLCVRLVIASLGIVTVAIEMDLAVAVDILLLLDGHRLSALLRIGSEHLVDGRQGFVKGLVALRFGADGLCSARKRYTQDGSEQASAHRGCLKP
jgi:hypothetical protein